MLREDPDGVAEGSGAVDQDGPGEQVAPVAEVLCFAQLDQGHIFQFVPVLGPAIRHFYRDVLGRDVVEGDVGVDLEGVADLRFLGDADGIDVFHHQLRPGVADLRDPGRQFLGFLERASFGAPSRLRRRAVEGVDVVLEHPLGRDGRAEVGQGVLDHGHPVRRYGFRAGLRGPGRAGVRGDRGAVETRSHLGFQELIERGGFDVIAFGRGRVVVRGRDRPAVLAVVHLIPPAIQDRKVQGPVDGRLHPRGPAGLQGPQRVVQPHVAAREQGAGHRNVVIGQEHDPVPHGGVVGELHQVLDHFLARIIGRVGLAGDDQLDGVLRVQQQRLEPGRVPQHQGQPLVSRHAPGEPDREHVRVQHRISPAQLRISRTAHLPRRPEATPDVLNQGRTQLAPQAPELGIIHAVDLVPTGGIHVGAAEVVCSEPAHLRIDPRRYVDAVGDGGDGDFGVVEAWPEPGEHLAGDHAVEFGHAVGPLRQAQAHDGHVEHRGVAAVVVFPAQVQDLLHRHVRGQAGVEEVPDLHGLETVDAGRDRGVGGEHRGRAPGGEGFGPAQRRLGGHQFLDPFDAQEPGVAFVGVEDLRGRGAGEALVDPQRLHPAHAQQQFLLEAVVPAPAVEAVRDPARGVVVGRNVRIEQPQRHAPDVGPPDARVELASVGQRQRDRHRLAGAVLGRFAQQCEGQAVGVKDRVGFLLPGVPGQGLLEIAGLVEQPDADQRHAQVRGGFQVVPGQDPQTARILRKHLGNPELRREIRDARRSLRPQALVPARLAQVPVQIRSRLLHTLDKFIIGSKLVQLIAAD